METIPVPPGMTAAQFLEAQELATNLRIVAGTIMALFLWDYVVLFPREMQLYRMSLSKSSPSMARFPAFWCFVVLRYSPFLAASASIAFSSFNVNDCQKAANVSFAGVLLMQVSSGGIFLLRIFALLQLPFRSLFEGDFTRRKAAALVLVLLYAVNIGCWIAVLPGYGFTTGPRTQYGSNCVNPTTYSWSALSYGTSFLFDSYVLAITFACHIKSGRRGGSLDLSGIMGLVVRDGALYFFFATVCNLIAFSMNLLPASLSYYRSFATPFASFAVTTMGQRVFLNLRLIDAGPAGPGAQPTSPRHSAAPRVPSPLTPSPPTVPDSLSTEKSRDSSLSRQTKADSWSKEGAYVTEPDVCSSEVCMIVRAGSGDDNSRIETFNWTPQTDTDIEAFTGPHTQ